MKGYKAFKKGMICDPTGHNPKQYAENTVFEEDTADICKSGMYFCENPFDVLNHYGYVNENGELNEFAEVEALEEVKTDDGKKYCAKKLKIGAKLSISDLCKAFVNFTFDKVDFDYSAATNTGYRSAATNMGYRSAATNTGDYSAATVEGENSFAIATGFKSKAKGKLGCYIAVAEWEKVNNKLQLKDFKAHKVDGEIIKEDTFYRLVNGKFVEADEND